MSHSRALRIATLLVSVGAVVAAFWWRALWPMLTRTGPAPGAGAQYVFVLLPTAALAALASAGGVLLAGRAWQQGAGARAAFLVALGILAALALAAFLVPGAAGLIAG